MSVLFTADLKADHPCYCDDCGWKGRADGLEWIQDASERLSPGSPCPAGECPECGALAYVQDEPDHKDARIAELERVLTLCTDRDDLMEEGDALGAEIRRVLDLD